MNVSSLKIARLVSKTWKLEADLEITHRDCFRLRFDPASRPLTEGLKELELSKDVPCFDFHLTLSESEDDDQTQLAEIKQLISLFGSQIKSLTLNSKVTGEDSLLTLLIGAKNMEKLYLTDKFESEGFTQRDLALKLTLPEGALSHLKHVTYLAATDPFTLHISARSRVLEIVDKAPNLQSINNMDFYDKLLLEDALKFTLKDKFHLLKSLGNFSRSPDVYSNSNNKGIKVETLFMRFNSAKQESVRKVVKSSEDTLNNLITVSRFICLPKDGGFGPLFLPFQNLKVLQIWVEEEMWKKFTRINFEPKHLTQFKQEAFPNLTTVILELPYTCYLKLPYYSSYEQKYSPFRSCIKSVVHLELRGQANRRWSGRRDWEANDNWVQRLQELFPNVKCLKLRDSSEIPHMLPFCFAHWPQLESLEIHINFKRPLDMPEGSRKPYFGAMEEYENLDAVFTGKTLEEGNHEAQDLNSTNSNSLTSLSELKKLDLVFSDIRPGISRTKCPISSVSCLHAFKLVPNLKVRVLYDQNLAKFDTRKRTFKDEYKMDEYLEDLIPHCELGHWENGGVASGTPAKIPPRAMSTSIMMPNYY